MVTGSESESLLSQVCNFNLRNSGDDLVMTQLAGVSCSILKRRWGELSGYQIWSDGTFGPYLWATLLGLVRQLGGDAVGTSATSAP